MPSATADCPCGDPDRDREREGQARARLEEHEPAVEAEPLVAGQPAAREVARRVGEHRHDEDPVERRRAVEQVVLDRPPQRQRDDEEREREARLDDQRRAQRVVVLEAARAAVGDRAREQLLDRPVDHRDGHEQHRPQQRDLLVVDVVEDVRRDREVRERDHARWWRSRSRGCGRRGRSRTRRRARARALRAGRAASSTGTASAPRRPRRGAPSSDTNERLDQWLTCPGVLPRSLQVGAAGHVEPAPQRLARHRDEQPALGHARHLGHRVRRVGHVLEHLDRGRDVELVVGERHPLGLHHPVLEVGRLALLPLRLDRRVLEVDADHAPRREPLRPLVGQDRLAAADVEQRLRVGLREQLVERALEARHQPPDDRVGRAVLVVGVAGDRALGVARDGAHSFSASRSSVVAAAAGVRARGRLVAGRAARRARSARAGRRARARSGARARTCAGA